MSKSSGDEKLKSYWEFDVNTQTEQNFYTTQIKMAENIASWWSMYIISRRSNRFG